MLLHGYYLSNVLEISEIFQKCVTFISLDCWIALQLRPCPQGILDEYKYMELRRGSHH